MIIKISLNSSSIGSAIQAIEQYKEDLDRKCNELAERLASMGATVASLGFSRAFYTGPVDLDIEVEDRGNNTYAVVASGETVLFLEFGSGITMGYGHPEPMGYGPGTYPGKGHWDNPNGWYLPKEKGGGHTYGNPPTAAMYNAAKDIRSQIEAVAREVFAT